MSGVVIAKIPKSKSFGDKDNTQSTEILIKRLIHRKDLSFNLNAVGGGRVIAVHSPWHKLLRPLQ